MVAHTTDPKHQHAPPFPTRTGVHAHAHPPAPLQRVRTDGWFCRSALRGLPHSSPALPPLSHSHTRSLTIKTLKIKNRYLIPYEQIPSYFKWLYHCSPFAYAMSALQIVLFRDVSFADCLPPPCPQACYGGRTLCFATGQEYLDSVNAKPSELGRKFGLLVAIFSVFLCGGYVCMSILVRRKTN